MMRFGDIGALKLLRYMLLTMNTGTITVFAASMIFSFIVIIASIGWIKDLYRLKKTRLKMK
jgi:hypothetical protein